MGERERNILQCTLMRDWPTTQAHALPGNRTGNFLPCVLTPNQLSHTDQGQNHSFDSKEGKNGFRKVFLVISWAMLCD